MTTLITGGTGKIGGSLARLLYAANHPFIIATRTGQAPSPFKAVRFDWNDPSTFENPFNADPSIDRIYLLGPSAVDVLAVVGPFIDLAISKGVKRIVLLTSSQSSPGSPGPGLIHKYVLEKGIDYTVLKPTWFMQNFGTRYLRSIKENDVIPSATGDGKIPWISSEDIAQAAFEALTSEKSLNKDIYVLGPELFSYDEVAELLSSVLGRKIIHKKNTIPEQEETFKNAGSPPNIARILSFLEGFVAQGKEAAFAEEPADRKFVGRNRLEEYLRANRQLWVKE